MSNPYDTAGERTSVLPRTLRFKGELSADEDALIQGSIEGVIQHTQRAMIGAEGHVKVSITAQVIRVEGTVEGDLHAKKSVYLAWLYAPSILTPEIFVAFACPFTCRRIWPKILTRRSRNPLGFC